MYLYILDVYTYIHTYIQVYIYMLYTYIYLYSFKHICMYTSKKNVPINTIISSHGPLAVRTADDVLSQIRDVSRIPGHVMFFSVPRHHGLW